MGASTAAGPGGRAQTPVQSESSASSPALTRRAYPNSPGDVAALAALRFTWRADERGETGDRATFAAALGTWWEEHAATHLAWIAERDHAPVGMVWLGIVHRIPGPQHPRRLAGIVQSAYVLPAGRNAGTGARLLAVLVEQARRDGLDYLMVHPSERSYPFYQRAGFADTGRGLELGLTGPRLPFGTA